MQYQPITGPVWREPVAEKLAWLPRDRYAGRRLAGVGPRDWTVYPFQVSVPAYSPSALDWLPRDRYVGRGAPRGQLDWSQPNQPTFVYDLVDWLPQGQQPSRTTARVPLRDWSIYPFQVNAPAFDPRTLEWIPRARAPQVALERRRLGDFEQPPFQALYKPEGLQWQPEDSYRGRALPRALLDWTVELQLVVTVPYDPRTLEWLPSGRAPRNIAERRILGDFQQPAFDALYKPDRLQWVPSDRYMWRALPFARQGFVAVEPPQAALYRPEGLQWMLTGWNMPAPQFAPRHLIAEVDGFPAAPPPAAPTPPRSGRTFVVSAPSRTIRPRAPKRKLDA